MNVLRINLHIRSDVSPHLYMVLATMPAKPRAEFIRKIAELGLQIDHRPAFSPEYAKTIVADNFPDVHVNRASDPVPDVFGEDLASAIPTSP